MLQFSVKKKLGFAHFNCHVIREYKEITNKKRGN